MRSAGASSGIAAVMPGTAMPAASVGSRSASEPEPYSGTGAESRVERRGVSQGGGPMPSAGDVRGRFGERLREGQGLPHGLGAVPASLTRRLRSSAVELPV